MSINTDGSGMMNLTRNPADDYSPRWSPDGSQVAFQTDRDGNWEIYRMDADGANPSRSHQQSGRGSVPVLAAMMP